MPRLRPNNRLILVASGPYEAFGTANSRCEVVTAAVLLPLGGFVFAATGVLGWAAAAGADGAGEGWAGDGLEIGAAGGEGAAGWLVAAAKT